MPAVAIAINLLVTLRWLSMFTGGLLLSMCLASNAVASDDIWTLLTNPELQEASHAERVAFWAEHFLDLPYHSDGPLGEGTHSQWDSDPLYRFDAFDCTTYIETVLALSHSTEASGFASAMNVIRYANGVPKYEERNHLITTAWVPNAIKNSFISRFEADNWSWAKRSTRTEFNYGQWLERQLLEQFNVPGKTLAEYQWPRRYPPANVDSDYLSNSDLLADWSRFQDAIETPHVVNFVRPGWSVASSIGTDLLVSHQGLLLKDKATGEVQLLHASSAGSVVKVPLQTYLLNLTDSNAVKGIQVFAIKN